jgi:hypothetical protein
VNFATSLTVVVRRNLTHDHITIMITTNAKSKQFHPYLLFPGQNTTVIPLSILEHPQIIGNYTESGWMDQNAFQAFILQFI